MPTVDLTNLKELSNPAYFPLFNNRDRYLVLYGGAGGGKSWFVCEKIIIRTLKEKQNRFLIIRKVARTLRRSVFRLFRDYIIRWGLTSLFTINKSDMTIICKNGNIIYFAGVDDPEKLKSIEGITSIWIEEATELNVIDFEEIDRRLRGKNVNYKQIILTYNPILNTNWTYNRFFVGEQKNTTIVRTTYKDNRFIDENYKHLLESYKGNTRTVYTLGRYGQLENAIYTNWSMIDDKDFPDDEPVYGLDFGFIAPNALVKVVVDMKEKKIYLHEEIYKTRQTISMLLKDIEELNIKDKRIIADSEAPEKIEEMNTYGYAYIEGAIKGKGSVIAGIDYVNQFEILITKSSTNIKKEIEGYQRHKDKDGNIYEQPEKGMDHAMDAFRYVMYTYYMEGVPYYYVLE